MQPEGRAATSSAFRGEDSLSPALWARTCGDRLSPAPFRRAFELELEPWPEGVILQVNGGKTGVKAGRDLRGVLDRENGGSSAP
jgi:hypothetical protein